MGQGFLGGRVLFEARGGGGLGPGLVAFGVEWRLAAFGRSQGEFGAGIDERVVGRGEFFEPEAGFVAGAAERIVRSQNHGNFHSIGIKK